MLQQTQLPQVGQKDGAGGSERYRVLFLEFGGGPGGPTNFLWYLFTCLDRSTLNPLLFTLFATNSSTLDHIRELGIPVRSVRSRPRRDPALLRWIERSAFFRVWALRIVAKAYRRFYGSAWYWWAQPTLALGLYRILKRERIELLVLNQDICYHFAGAIAAKLAGIPCVCRKAGGIREGDLAKKFTVPWVDLFVAISGATAADQQRHKATKRLEIIHEGVDLRRFSDLNYDPRIAAELAVPAGRKVVASVSRLSSGKGQRELILAAGFVLQRQPDVVFLIVGEEGLPGVGLKGQLQMLARELGIEESVIFTGWREDVQRVLKIVDIFVHCPTASEGLSIACLEAAAMGKPIVGSYNGGIPDVVIDGVNGLLVQPGDVEAMAAAILKLLENEDLARCFGRNSRLRAEKEFDMAARAKELEALFFEYAAKGRAKQWRQRGQMTSPRRLL